MLGDFLKYNISILRRHLYKNNNSPKSQINYFFKSLAFTVKDALLFLNSNKNKKGDNE